MKKTFGLVVTTIFDGKFLDEYYEHFRSQGVLDSIRFYVVGDLSTPASCRERVNHYAAQGLKWVYLGKEEQEEFLKPFPELAREIPWKSDNRRNIGFLMAYRDRCDVVVAIDDDNYPKTAWPFAQGHSVVGEELTQRVATGHQRWFNLCSMMKVECPSLAGGEIVYPRGMPYLRRDPKCSQVSNQRETGRIGMNVGLWSGDPDVDAATRMVTRCETREEFQEAYFLATESHMPINTQNTALIRDAIPAYYYVKMGHPVGGMKLDRYGDIFSGYFVQKCVKAVGQKIAIGGPVVDHRRSPHNLYKDLWNELAGMVVIDDMVELIETPLSKASTYEVAYEELAQRIEAWSQNQSGFLWDTELKAYFSNVTQNMRIWMKACADCR